MAFEIMNRFSTSIQRQAVQEIEECNDFTSRFGLALSQRDALELVETRTLSLKNNGRIEFGSGVIGVLIREFCDSPFISVHNYVETLHGLIEIFYFYKNETLDLVSDDDLINFMKDCFDGKCQGSLELLSGRELANLARNLRFGNARDYLENIEQDGKGEDGEY